MTFLHVLSNFFGIFDLPSCIGLWPIKTPKNINKAYYSLIPLFFCWFRIRVNPISRIRSVVDRHYKYIKKYNYTMHKVHSHKCYHIAYCESHKKLCKYLQITFNPPAQKSERVIFITPLKMTCTFMKKIV